MEIQDVENQAAPSGPPLNTSTSDTPGTSSDRSTQPYLPLDEAESLKYQASQRSELVKQYVKWSQCVVQTHPIDNDYHTTAGMKAVAR